MTALYILLTIFVVFYLQAGQLPNDSGLQEPIHIYKIQLTKAQCSKQDQNKASKRRFHNQLLPKVARNLIISLITAGWEPHHSWGRGYSRGLYCTE